MKLFPLLLGLALAGCVSAGKRGATAALAVYDLGAPPAREAADDRPQLALEVRAPSWLDSSGIEYRLAYAEPGRLRAYAQARWAGPPAMLVQQRLLQQLGLVPAGAECLLRIDIDEFSQIFDTPQNSRGTLRVRLSLLDHSRNVVAERAAAIDQPAPSPDSRGGVAALTAAVAKLGDEVDAWRGELAAAGRLKACAR